MTLAAAQLAIRDTTPESVNLESLTGVSLPPFLHLGWPLGRFGIDMRHNAFGGTTGFIGREFGWHVSYV